MTTDLGRWRAICDRCGSKYFSDQLRKEWTGLMTCHGGGTHNCWEPRHPQDFVRGVPDKQTVPWTRPEATDVSVSPFIEDEDLIHVLSDVDDVVLWEN